MNTRFRLAAAIVAAIEMIVLLVGLACAGTTTESTSDRDRIYMRTGSPFTTEHDYSLEDDPDTYVVNTESEETETADTESPIKSVCETNSESVGESVCELSGVSEEPTEEAEPVPLPAPQDDEDEPRDDKIALSDEDLLSAEYIAKALHGECGSGTKTEQAAVVWCILNRVDSDLSYMPDDIISVVTQEKQFAGYSADRPVREDLLELAMDVILRWRSEQAGQKDVGRVLPKEFMYFRGDGYHNYFRNESNVTENTVFWDWSLDSPY